MAYLSLDVQSRGRVTDANDNAPLTPIDETRAGETICEAMRSRHAITAAKLIAVLD